MKKIMTLLVAALAALAAWAENINVGPLLTTKWDQISPYINFGPIKPDQEDGYAYENHMVNGCVAVAYSQVLKYWNWPEVLDEDITYSHMANSTPGYVQTLPAGIEFNWDKQLDDYVTSKSTEAQQLYLGLGQIYTAMLTEMKFNLTMSGVNLERAIDNSYYMPGDLLNTVGQTTLAMCKDQARDSIVGGMPLIMGVTVNRNGSSISHAIVGDGWKESAGSDPQISCNYGWGGTSDGFTAFNLETSRFIANLRPRPMVIIDAVPYHAALPVKVTWHFPKKGYETALTGFDVKAYKVTDETFTWEENFDSPKGAAWGEGVTTGTLDGSGNDGSMLKFSTESGRDYYAWPTMFLGEGSVLSFRVRSDHIRSHQTAWVEAYEAHRGWKKIRDLTLHEFPPEADNGWEDVTVELDDSYDNRAVGFRIRTARAASGDNWGQTLAYGIQIDDVKITNVRKVETTPTATQTVGSALRSASFDSGLDVGKKYMFVVEPLVENGIMSNGTGAEIVASEPEKVRFYGVQSIHSNDPQFDSENIFREAYLGTNQFAVFGSPTMTKLRAKLSQTQLIDFCWAPDAAGAPGAVIASCGPVSVADAVKVECAEPGKFLVTVDFSRCTKALRFTREIITLEGEDDLGNIARKNIVLRFSKIGNETAIAKEQIPEYGGTIPSEEEEEERPATCLVTFVANYDGGSSSAKNYTIGDIISSFPSVSRTGYTLDGWYTAATGGTEVFASTKVNGGTTYYAHWLKDTTPDPEPGDDPEEPSGDDPVVDPSNGNANDFTEGGVNYRFCNGVNTTSGYFDVNRRFNYDTLPQVSYNLVYWWIARYAAAFGDEPDDYVAPAESSMPTSDGTLKISEYTATVLNSALAATLPAGAEREKYFPAEHFTAADWHGTSSADKAVQIGRHIYAALAKGPIGFKVHTSSSKWYGGVIWGCEYSSDDTGKYATRLWVTDTRVKNDGIKAFVFGNYSNTYGSLPGLKDFNGSGNHGVIEYYYPIVGPAVAGEDADEPDPDPQTEPEPDPDPESELPDVPDVPADDKIGEADDADNPGNNYTSSYGYEMHDNYWTARKRAMKQGKQLFVLSGAAWCSNCAFVKGYLKDLGTAFSNKFVVYYSDNDSTACNCFRGGLPQYGAADPRKVDAFTGTLNGSVRSWDIAWQTDTSGIYAQDRGGYAPERVDLVVNKGKEHDAYGTPTNLVIRGLSTLGAGTTGRYELYAQYEDGVEMPVDCGVDWEIVSGNGVLTDANVDGRDVAALSITSGSVVIRATSAFYFTGIRTMTVECAPESDIESVEILTSVVNLEDDATPTIEAQATLTNGKKIPVFGFGTWTATFKEKLPRTKCPELEENSDGVTNPDISIDSASRLNYALTDGLLKVCDQKIDVTLTVNGKTTTKEITVWGPTKVIASKWTMVSGPKQSTRGVVRLQCSELTYNYGGEIKTTADTYFASFATVLKSGISSQVSYLRGLTVFVDNFSEDKTYTVDLKAQKVNGKYKSFSPDLFTTSDRAKSVEALRHGTDKTDIEKGAVPEGFFKAFFPERSDYATLADEDEDHDGFRNWEEYVLGTDPTDANDAFTLMQGYQHLAAPAANGATMQYKVMYQQRAGRVYYIEAKNAWGDEWMPVATVDLEPMKATDVTTFSDLNASFADGAKFFRVRASLKEHVFNDPATAPKITPNMLVAAPGAIIDLTTANTLPLEFSSFDTDATDPGTVWVKVAADTAAGTTLMTAPKSAEKSLKACQPKDSGDIAFEVVADPEDANRMVLKVKGDDTKWTVEVSDEKIVVTPNEDVTEITIADLGEKQVEIPPSIGKIGGVDDVRKIVIRGGGHDITRAMKFTAENGGFRIELDEEGKVTIGGEEIRVRPELADASKDEQPFEMQDGQLVFKVKSIPGLKYQVLASDSLEPNSFEPAGAMYEATGTRRELSVTASGETKGFYKIQVSR